MKKSEILNLKIEKNLTIKGYLCMLLTELYVEEECFSGKRPFGNSGWKYDLYHPLVEAEVVEGYLDEDGYIEEVNKAQADELILDLIKECFK